MSGSISPQIVAVLGIALVLVAIAAVAKIALGPDVYLVAVFVGILIVTAAGVIRRLMAKTGPGNK